MQRRNPRKGNAIDACFGMFVSWLCLLFPAGWGNPAVAQITAPETRLTPIGPPAGFAPNQNFSPNSNFGGSLGPISGFTPSPAFPANPGTFPPSTGSFDPYTPAPNPGITSGIGGFAPGLGLGQGPGSGVAVIGPPTAIPSTSPSTIAPSPPGGGLLSQIFSRPASAPTTGVPSFGTANPNSGQPGLFGGSPLQGQAFSAPMYGQPGAFDNGNVYGPPVSGYPGSFGGQNSYGAPQAGFPSTVYPSSTPTTLFPEGLFSGGIFSGVGGGGQYNSFRLFQGPRLRHTFVEGLGSDDPDDFDTNDTDVSLVFAFPNFLYSSQPLYVAPSFSLHQWDGPLGSSGADLPSSAYSGFLDVGWNSDPNQMIGTELGVRIGAFTDFDTFNNDSIRVLGKALVNFRVTPASTFKAGAYYLDRNKTKLVPAVGLLWQPNPTTRFDIFFPQPKFSRYWRTLGTQDVWGYLTADYGGGSWTIKRSSGAEDSIDINEVRIVGGLEWGTSDFIRSGRRTGFIEVGYAFDREVEYRSRLRNIKPDDGIMFSAGIGY